MAITAFKLATVAFVVFLATAVTAAGSVSPVSRALTRPAALANTCPRGTVRAVIGGKASCLRAGARCKKRYESAYRRHGFHCANGRLARIPKKPVLPPAGTIIATIHVDSTAGEVAVGDSGVWVTNAYPGGATRIDPATNQATGTIPGQPQDFAPFVLAGDGGVWISNFNDNTVTRADPLTGAVAATIHVGAAPEGMAFTPGALWVANHHGTPTGSLSRIDPATNAVVATIPAGKAQDCCGPQAVAATDNAVWAGVPNLNAVVRVDPATNSIAATIPDPPACGGLAAATDALWVAAGCDSATVTRIDPATNRVVASISVAGTAYEVAIGFGSVWVATSYALDRIDPQTNKVVARLRLAAPPLPGANAHLAGMTIGDGSIWIVRDSDVLRIQPS